MSVSIDYKKMEKLASLEQALELLQNPESYTRLLAEVKQVTAAYTQAAAKHSSVEAADRFLSEATKMLTVAKQEAAELRETVKRERSEFETMVASKTRELDTRQGSVVQMEGLLKARKMALDSEIEDQVKRDAEFKSMIEKKSAGLMAREASLAIAEQRLAAKLVAFGQLANG